MIVGSGMVANSLTPIDNDQFLFFASGVSNSNETDPNEFQRERELLVAQLALVDQETFVYFSTCSIYDESVIDRPYTQHKLAMEEAIQDSGKNYLIARLSNLVGPKGNPNTLINYLVQKIATQSPFELWQNASRNLLGIDDFIYLLSKILQTSSYNQVVNIAYHKNYSVEEIVHEIERFLDHKADVVVNSQMGQSISIDTQLVENWTRQLEENRSTSNYIEYLLNTYYQDVK